MASGFVTRTFHQLHNCSICYVKRSDGCERPNVMEFSGKKALKPFTYIKATTSQSFPQWHLLVAACCSLIVLKYKLNKNNSCIKLMDTQVGLYRFPRFPYHINS
jgi:hypothetical protein